MPVTSVSPNLETDYVYLERVLHDVVAVQRLNDSEAAVGVVGEGLHRAAVVGQLHVVAPGGHAGAVERLGSVLAGLDEAGVVNPELVELAGVAVVEGQGWHGRDGQRVRARRRPGAVAVGVRRPDLDLIGGIRREAR